MRRTMTSNKGKHWRFVLVQSNQASSSSQSFRHTNIRKSFTVQLQVLLPLNQASVSYTLHTGANVAGFAKAFQTLNHYKPPEVTTTNGHRTPQSSTCPRIGIVIEQGSLLQTSCLTRAGWFGPACTGFWHRLLLLCHLQLNIILLIVTLDLCRPSMVSIDSFPNEHQSFTGATCIFLQVFPASLFKHFLHYI